MAESCYVVAVLLPLPLSIFKQEVVSLLRLLFVITIAKSHK